MPAVFDYHHQVQRDEIDLLGHVNNLVYLKWMQDTAIAHSDAHGWTTAWFTEFGQGFVVRSHRIKYLRPSKLNDRIIVRTWVENFQQYTANRRYEIMRIREEDGSEELAASAQTQWAYISLSTGQPLPIPQSMVQSFSLEAEPVSPLTNPTLLPSG